MRRTVLPNKLVAIIALLVMPAVVSFGSVRYVDVDAVGAGNGNSWADAYTTIAPAIAVASSNDELWIAEGLYTGALTCKTGVSLYGGFVGTETLRTQRDYTTHVTIINGAGSCTITAADGADLSGLTITGGGGNGGVYAFRVNPLIEYCVFTNNSGTAALNLTATGYPDGGMMNVRDCTFASNVNCRAILAETKVYWVGPHWTTIERCYFMGNDAGALNGGAIYITYDPGAVTIRNCVFSGNKATSGGAIGAVYSGDANGGNGTGLVVNCTFDGNTAVSGNSVGLGVQGTSPAYLRLVNCILWGSTTNQAYLNYGSVMPRANCCLQGGGTRSITLKNGSTSPDDGGNIGLDPMFRDADGLDDIVGTVDDDLNINANSPCIDTGTAVDAPPADIDGLRRPLDAGFDIGAYEYVSPIPPGTTIYVYGGRDEL